MAAERSIRAVQERRPPADARMFRGAAVVGSSEPCTSYRHSFIRRESGRSAHGVAGSWWQKIDVDGRDASQRAVCSFADELLWSGISLEQARLAGCQGQQLRHIMAASAQRPSPLRSRRGSHDRCCGGQRQPRVLNLAAQSSRRQTCGEWSMAAASRSITRRI